MVGVSTVVALSALITGVGAANASTHPTKSTYVSATRTASSAMPRAKQSGVDSIHEACNGVDGEVTGLTSSTITVLDREGTSTTYAVTSTTTVTRDRQRLTLSAVKIGENVHVAVRFADGAIAVTIDIVPATIAGEVAAVSDDTITVTGPNEEIGTIVVSGSTTFVMSGGAASLSDVTVGSFVFAEGSLGSTATTIDAASVGIGQPTPGTRPGTGGLSLGGAGGPNPMGAATPAPLKADAF